MRKYYIFTHYPSMLFALRSFVFRQYSHPSERRFGKLWRNWCAETITKEQFDRAKQTGKFRIRGVSNRGDYVDDVYDIVGDNKYTEVGATLWTRRVDNLETMK